MNNQRRALYLSHGGGPMPLLGDPSHAEMVACLQEIAATIEQPKAIIVVSAHWEERSPTITAGTRPELIYDYYGFPEEAYQISYPCPGNPELANAMADALRKADIKVRLDENRGFDHGLFIPLKIMYPQAAIPCVQLSLVKTQDPATHIAIGNALQSVADDAVLLIGSGFSFHNMQAFFSQETAETTAMNAAFERWLRDSCCDQTLTEAQRQQRLVDWQAAPFARYCHPREEHLLPLHVCYGFAGSACDKAYQLNILHKQSSMYLWDTPSG